MNQIGRQRRQPITSALGPAVFDDDVAALDIAGFRESLAEGGKTIANGFARRALRPFP